MHSGGKGISKSSLPYKRAPPSWLKITPEEVSEHITRLAKKGLTPSQIGIILRDSHGIAQVKNVTGNKILRILKANGTCSAQPPPATTTSSRSLARFLAAAARGDQERSRSSSWWCSSCRRTRAKTRTFLAGLGFARAPRLVGSSDDVLGRGAGVLYFLCFSEGSEIGSDLALALASCVFISVLLRDLAALLVYSISRLAREIHRSPARLRFMLFLCARSIFACLCALSLSLSLSLSRARSRPAARLCARIRVSHPSTLCCPLAQVSPRPSLRTCTT